MAGAGKKTFTAGETLTASDVNTYLMEQSVMVFGGTAARASAIPTPSTGMTSYIGVTGTATIPQLETYTGSAWQTPYGMTLVASQAITNSALVAFDNVFTSAYENYLIVLDAKAIGASGTTTQIRSRFRTGGVANTSGSYVYVVTQATSANTGPTNRAWSTGSTEAELADILSNSAVNNALSLEVFSPQVTDHTRWNFHASSFGSSSSSVAWQISSGAFYATTSFDGIQFSLTSGNITGSIRIYGYRNS